MRAPGPCPPTRRCPGCRRQDNHSSTNKPLSLPVKSRPRAKKTLPAWCLGPAEFALLAEGDPARPFARMLLEKPAEHCRWVHLAVRRHCMDLKHAAAAPDKFPYVYARELATRPIRFAAQFRIYSGADYGKPLHLLPWQQFVVSQVYGWRHRAAPPPLHLRLHRSAAQKRQDRPARPAGALSPMLYARAQFYSVATKEDQAKLVWKDAIRLLKTSPRVAALFRVRTRHLAHGPSGSEWAPLGSDSRSQDGLRPDVAIMDELHAWRDRELWDVISSAFGAAYSPLLFQITTAGTDISGICREQQGRVLDVLKALERGKYTGLKADQATYFGCVWTVDKTDKWDDPRSWAKANPSLGTVKSLENMEQLAATAKKSSGSRREFLLKHLNQWQSGGDEPRWLDPLQWAKGGPSSAPAPTPRELWERLRGLKVWCGLDLASVGDTSSFCAIAEDPKDPKKLLVAWHYWLPSEQIGSRSEKDAQPYDLWAAEGYLTLTEGSVTDVAQVEADIVHTLRSYELSCAKFAYDPGHEQGVAQRLQDTHSLPMFLCPQTYTALGPATDELERLVVGERLDHGGNPMAAAQASCVVVRTGPYGGRTPAKGRSRGRIDGIAALVDALAARAADLDDAARPKAFAVYFD